MNEFIAMSLLIGIVAGIGLTYINEAEEDKRLTITEQWLLLLLKIAISTGACLLIMYGALRLLTA